MIKAGACIDVYKDDDAVKWEEGRITNCVGNAITGSCTPPDSRWIPRVHLRDLLVVRGDGQGLRHLIRNPGSSDM